MSKILHITNGDNFTKIVTELPVDGTIITWREMLCEGKTLTGVGSELFWRTRYDFLNKTYKTTRKSFLDGMLREYKSLCEQKSQDEVVLWFDHDLSGQINMIAVLSWLKNHKKNIQVSLVSAQEEDTAQTLAQLSREKLLERYGKRTQLSEDDVEYADYIWQLYCDTNPIHLETFSKFNASRFQHLPDAIKAHILRFPSVKNGLDKVENNILHVAAENRCGSREALLDQLLQTEKEYGYTRMQYARIIENLKELFQSFDPVSLSKTGEKIAGNKTSYYKFMKNDEAYLGGSRKYSFLYHHASGKLLKL